MDKWIDVSAFGFDQETIGDNWDVPEFGVLNGVMIFGEAWGLRGLNQRIVGMGFSENGYFASDSGRSDKLLGVGRAIFKMPTEQWQWCNHGKKLHEWGFDQQTLGMSNSMIRNSIEERENKNDGRIWQVYSEYSARSNHLSVSQDQKEKKLAGLISFRLPSLFKHPTLREHRLPPKKGANKQCTSRF